MAIAICTENGANAPEFDFELYSGFDEDPVIAFSLPDDCWPDSEYDGQGNFVVKLEDILKEAVGYCIEFDFGEGAHKITSLLRDYADKMDAEAEKHKDRWGS